MVLNPLVRGGHSVICLLHYLRNLGAAYAGPLVILFIDEEEGIKAVLPHMKEVVVGGLMMPCLRLRVINEQSTMNSRLPIVDCSLLIVHCSLLIVN